MVSQFLLFTLRCGPKSAHRPTRTDLGIDSQSPPSATSREMPGPVLLGGWSPASVTPEARAALDRALAGSDLIVTNVLSVRSQVVAGTNYEFEVEGSSASHNQVTRFLVQVFDQPWTNTTQLKSVVPK